MLSMRWPTSRSNSTLQIATSQGLSVLSPMLCGPHARTARLADACQRYMMDALLVNVLKARSCSQVIYVYQDCTGLSDHNIYSRSDAVTDLHTNGVFNHGSIAVVDCKLAAYRPQHQLQLGVGASNLLRCRVVPVQLGDSVGASSIGSASDERRGCSLSIDLGMPMLPMRPCGSCHVCG